MSEEVITLARLLILLKAISMYFMIIRGAFILIIYFLATNLSWAQVTKKALFLGNSYTAYNNLPMLIGELAFSTLDTLEFDAISPGGFRFSRHATHPPSLDKIKSEDWDFVSLQGNSLETSLSEEVMEVDVYPYVDQLVKAIRDNRECTTPLFYMTWGRKEGNAIECPFMPRVCTYEGMDDIVKATYLYLSKRHKGKVAPAGAIWRYIRENHPEIELYVGDGSHPTLAGSYAAACAFYVMIFEKDPTGITFNSTLSIGVANKIRNAAKEVVFKHYEDYDFFPAEIDTTFSISVSDEGLVTYNTTENRGIIRWDFGDGIQSTERSPQHQYVNSGDFVVKLFINYCGNNYSSEKKISVNLSTAIEELQISSIHLYPNPASDHLWIKSKFRSIKYYEIFDSKGQILIKKEVSQKINKVDTKIFIPGLYFLRLTDANNAQQVFRFVKR